MLVVGSSATVLKPSGRTILFYDKKSFCFYNQKGIAVGCLTNGLHAFLCTHFFLFFFTSGEGWLEKRCCFNNLKELCENIKNILI